MHSLKRNFFFNLFAELVLNILPLFWMLYLNTKLTPELFVEFMHLGAVYSLSRVVVEYGMNNDAIVRYNNGDLSVVNDLFVTRFFLLIPAVSFAYFYSCVLSDITEIVFFLYFSPIIFIPVLFDWLNKAKGRGDINALSAGISTVCCLAPFVFFDPEYNDVLIIRFCWFFLYTLGIFVQAYSECAFRLTVFTAKKMIELNKKYFIASLLIVGGQAFPIMLASEYLIPKEAALYSLLYKIYTLLLLLKSVIAVSFLPKMSTDSKQYGMVKLFGFAFKVGLFLSLFVVLSGVGMLFSKDVLWPVLHIDNSYVADTVVFLFVVVGCITSIWVLVPSIFVVYEYKAIFVLFPMIFMVLYVIGGWWLYCWGGGVVENLMLLLITDLFVLLVALCLWWKASRDEGGYKKNL